MPEHDARGRCVLMPLRAGTATAPPSRRSSWTSRRSAAVASGVAALLGATAARASETTAETPAQATAASSPSLSALSETTVQAAEAGNGAGTQRDAVKVLQSLPGLGRGSAGSGDVIAWGSTPRESKLYLDDVEIPRLYHGSGVRSVVPSPWLSTISVSPGAFGVELGDSVGGLVRLSSASLDDTRAFAELHADLLDAGAIASAPLPLEHSAVRAAARYGYVDRWLPGALDSDARSLLVVPRYWDAQADASFSLAKQSTLRVATLVASDTSRNVLEAPDPADVRSETVDAYFGRVYAKYESRGSDGSETSLTPFFGWGGNDREGWQGALPSALRTSSTSAGFRARERLRASDTVALTFGADAAATFAHVAWHGARSLTVIADDYDARIASAAPYAALAVELGPVSIEPGVRVDGMSIASKSNGSNLDTSTLRGLVDPRGTIAYAPSARTTVFVSAGRYHQAPDVVDLGAFSGNPRLAPERATHVALGERARLTRSTAVELVIFSKWLDALPASSPEVLPRESESIVAEGSGRAYGVQLFLRQRPVAGFAGFFSATLSRSERQDPGRPMRLSGYDAPLVTALGAEKTLGPLRFALRARAASGLPRTPVVAALLDARSGTYVPVLGPPNTIRLGTFFQLDLRVDYRRTFSERGELDVYVDALNVTAHANDEDYVYSGDLSQRRSVGGVPRLVFAGVSVHL